MQTRKMTLVEVVIDVFCGMGVAVLTIQLFIFLGIVNITILDNLYLTATITVLSIIRRFIIRRIFIYVEENIKISK